MEILVLNFECANTKNQFTRQNKSLFLWIQIKKNKVQYCIRNNFVSFDYFSLNIWLRIISLSLNFDAFKYITIFSLIDIQRYDRPNCRHFPIPSCLKRISQHVLWGFSTLCAYAPH